MQCPYCGQEMSEGEIIGSGQSALIWLPSGAKFPPLVTRQGIEKRGGVWLSGREFVRSATSAWRCPSCKKLILEY